MKKALICFTRVPVAGQTKTRLMPALSGEQCAALHTAFLRDIAAVCASAGADLFVAYAPGGPLAALRDIFPRTAGFFPQQGADLGSRMHHALCRVLDAGYDACVLFGSDLPELTAGHLESGFSVLERADAVLGPTHDGGYYLVGLRAPCEALFRGQSYGGASVYENALAAALAAGRTVEPALPCADVDTPEDLRRLWRRIGQTDSHTAGLLRQLAAQGVI